MPVADLTWTRRRTKRRVAPADVTVEAEVDALVGAAVERFGRRDGAFNNAGGAGATVPVQDLDAATWHADLAQNLTSVFLSLRAEIRAIRATAGGGSIVNNASTAAVAGMPSYAAAKHGVLGLTRAAALGCAADGVRVNALVTGNVDTPLYRRRAGAPPDLRATTCMPPTRRAASRTQARSRRSSPSSSAPRRGSRPAPRSRSTVASRRADRAAQPAVNPRMSCAVSSGTSSCGQWPIPSSSTQSACGSQSRR